MFHILSRIVSPTTPKLHFLRNHPWLYVKFFSSNTSSSSRSKGNSFVVSYLIGTCGFPPERAASVSKYLSFKTSEKPELVFEFFKSLGFSHPQVLSLISYQPKLLLANPEKSLMPKIEYFKSLGFSDSDICRIIMRRPHILARSLNTEIIPTFDIFNNLFQSKPKLMKTIMGFPDILCDFDKITLCNMKLLRDGGVPESLILRFIEYYPRTLKAHPKKFKEVLQELEELQFNHQRIQFVVAIHVKICIVRSTQERKEGIYKKWGWADHDISAAFRAYPWCIVTSDNKIEAIMDFLVNKMGYTSSAIAKFPAVLAMSLEKRIIPRGSVILLLMSKSLMKQCRLSTAFKSNEKVFLDKFVSCHENEADDLLKLYRAKIALAR